MNVLMDNCNFLIYNVVIKYKGEIDNNGHCRENKRVF